MTTGIFIDDDETQQTVISALLAESGIDFSRIVEPTKISEIKARILELAPDIIVMDYRLDEVRKEGFDSDFRAGGLAQVLRETFLDHPEKDAPIVLLSTETNIRNLFTPDKTSHDLFDMWFLKGTVQSTNKSEKGRVFDALSGLISGYSDIKRIRDGTEPGSLVRSLLNVNEEEFSRIQSDGLKPLIVNAAGEAEATHLIARHFLSRLIRRPGILLDECSLRAKLGIAEGDTEGFKTLSEAAGFNAFLYDGIFAGGWRRYWRHRFNSWAAQTIDQPLSGMTATKRIEDLNTKFGLKLVPAVSRWSGSSDEYFAVACRVCHNPTELRHSVACFDPLIAVYMERGRICYDCVDKQDELDRIQIRIDENDEKLVDDIRSNRLKRPNE